MKGVAVILLCALACVQGRQVNNEKFTKAVAVLGENPWIVHIRSSVFTSASLNSCIGSLIDARFILTSAACLYNGRFFWLRYGAVDTLTPELVTEISFNVGVSTHPDYDASTGVNNIGLILNSRVVHSTPNIKPVALERVGADISSSGKFCAYGGEGVFEDGTAGNTLSCVDVQLQTENNLVIASSYQGRATYWDTGAPLVIDGVQHGILVSSPGPNDSIAGIFLRVGNYVEWISEVTGLEFGGESEESSEQSEESSEQSEESSEQSEESSEQVEEVRVVELPVVHETVKVVNVAL